MPRHAPHIFALADGRRVPFTISLRNADPFYFVYFRSPQGRRLERSTKESSQKRALEAAHQIIREEYEPHAVTCNVTWDEALAALVKHMQANGNRPTTIDDYLDSVKVVREFFPAALGPADITPALAKQFKADYQTQPFVRGKQVPAPAEPSVTGRKRPGPKPKPKPPPKAHCRSSYTLASRLNKLRVIWSRWFIKELEYFKDNPWKVVSMPKRDKLSPRYLTADEIQAFFAWLHRRWCGWRLPILFLTVKGLLGNRIGELCSLRTEQLREGRVVIPADIAKGREERKALLPADVYAEVRAIAGPTFVWEAYPAQLLAKLKELDKPCTNVQPEFSPDRLKWWVQDELDDYCKAHPDVKRFSAHAFRKKAMTEAYKLGIPLEKAAVAFGCNPNTMRQHYLALDKTAIADEVLTAIAGIVQPRVEPSPSQQETA